MKRPLQLLAGITACILFASLFFNPDSAIYKNNKYADQVIDEGIMRFSGADKQLRSWFRARAYPEPFYLNDKFMNGWRQAEDIRNKQLMKEADINTASWSNIGPDIGIGGRILCIAIDPSDGTRLFAGSASGGIWKSTNRGSSWSSVTTGLPVQGVSSIIINPDNTDIMYAGTGEIYRVDSTDGNANPGNTGFNVWKTRGTYGIGIIKSTDGGITWSQVMYKSTSELFAISQLRFDPSNPDIVYACATDGLYRSTDAGVNWTRIFAVTMCTDVVINGSNIMVGAGNLGNTRKGIWRSTNGGTSFTKLSGTIPSSFQGFIKFGWVASAPNTILASINRGTSTSSTEVFRTTNFGNTWSGVTGTNHSRWQYWFTNAIAINPSNGRFVHAGVDVYQYNSGTNDVQIGSNIHDDIHDIEFDPSNSNYLYVCSDGGIYRSTNGNTTSPTFSPINNGLVAIQFYASFGVSRQDPELYIGGLQDNGVVIHRSSGWSDATWVGGDGTACAIDPNDHDNMIASRDARGLHFSSNRGTGGSSSASYWGYVADSRTAFVAPVAYAPSNSSRAYCATDNLHISTNYGSSWSNNGYSTANNYIEAYQKTSIALAVSPTNSNKVYVSTSPFSQYDDDGDDIYYNGPPNILKTTTGNTPFTIIKGAGATALPDRYIMDIAVSEGDDDSVFVALGGYGTGHVYVTGDGGATWVNKGAGLPDVPFNAVLIDPVNPNVIYAACDLGVYVSPNRGNNWYDFNNGLPEATFIMDLQYTADNQLLAISHGRGVFRGPRYTGTLPVDIISFNGELQNRSNRLKWEVGNEDNVAKYELERGETTSSFAKIASIQANGNSSYNYNDDLNPLKSYYYRLKIVDHDGSFKYSNIIHLKRNEKIEFKVLGNPFVNSIDLKVSVNQNSKGQINLYDAGGKLIRRETYEFGAGMSTYSIKNLSSLPSGTYYLEALIGNNHWKQKILKK